MGIRINGGDYNLPTLAGEVSVLTAGHDLPYDLYVFGSGSTTEAIYIDPHIPQANRIVEFLCEKGIPAREEMPFTPNQRPAIAITRGMRSDDRIVTSATVVAFVLFVMHETIVLNNEELERLFHPQEVLEI